MDKSGHEMYVPIKGDHDFNNLGISLNSPTFLVIRLPDSRALRLMSASLLLTVFFLAALPSLSSSINGGVSLNEASPAAADGFKILPILLRDLLDEGLIKKGHRGFVLDAPAAGMDDDFDFLKDAGVDLLTRESAHQVFDFVFATSFGRIHLADGMIKEDGGLVITPLGRDPSDGLQLLSSYKIVYLRRFENTVVAMRKTASNAVPPKKEVFYGGRVTSSEEKKALLKGLEDVDLEPPPNEKKPSFTSRKIKFLPDLLEDSLDEYPRRVFIADDASAVDWFYKSYPMRDQEFEVYKLESGEAQETGWLTKKVRREDYVVMKAEAQVVEEMLKDKSLGLVDELFLECKNQWEEGSGSKRAYWQCLALYGKVRDEGIAVHQWWD